jgi:multidrug efflux system membrane fusion protein
VNRNYQLSALIAVLLVVWLSSGLLRREKPDQYDLTEASAAEELTKVRARYIQAQSYTRILNISATTEARRSVQVRAEVEGLVLAVAVQKGRAVKQGEALCQLSEDDRQLRVQQDKALLARARLEYDGAQRLKSGGFQSRTTIAAKKAELETAKANLYRSELDLQKLTIAAPFDGVFLDHAVEQGDFMRRGDICGTVLELNPLLVSAEVSAKEVEQLQLGQQATAQLVSGDELAGTLTYISHQADPVTRAYRIEVEVANGDYRYRSGISAQLSVAAGELQAHRLSPALLSLDDNGLLGVRILDKDNRVHFVRVTVVGDEPAGIWVSGLPRRSLLITVGQGYVSNGQQVSVVVEAEQARAARP